MNIKPPKKSLLCKLCEATSLVSFASGVPLIGILSTCITFYCLIWSQFWLPVVCYLFWIWVLDKRTPAQGGRKSQWVCSLKVFKYARDYYPVKLICVPGFEIDATKNYLFCCHPHGIMPHGVILTCICNQASHTKLLSHLKFYIFTISSNFWPPIYRDIMLAMGFCQASTESISYILKNPSGGNAGVLYPGGAEEAYNSKPGTYHLVLKNRKGFIKLALQNGYPIVPLFSFGEVDTFNQVRFPEGSLMRNFQNWIKSVIGMAPILFYGVAYLPIIPKRTPIHIVVGKPLYVEHVQNPTKEEIDALHEKYVQCVIALFEENKHSYITNPDSAVLRID